MDESQKQALAEDRTDWAEDRTVLANERTFAGWMRTGLGSLGMAIALQAIFGAAEPTWIARSVASLFVLVALVIFYSAWRSSGKMLERLEAHTAQPASKTHMGVIAGIMAIATLAAGAILWII